MWCVVELRLFVKKSHAKGNFLEENLCMFNQIVVMLILPASIVLQFFSVLSKVVDTVLVCIPVSKHQRFVSV